MDQAIGLRKMMANHNRPAADCLQAEQQEIQLQCATTPVRVISVTSGKGGVGKTNVVANLAIALQQRGKKVLVLDADLGLGNIDVLLGLDPPYTMQDVLRGKRKLEEILVPGPAGITILPATSGVVELTHLSDSERLSLLDELDTLEECFDALIIDTGAGISANVMYFNMAAQEKVVIANSEPTSLTDAYALIKVLYTRYRETEFKVLVNGVEKEDEAEMVYRQLSTVAIRFLGGPSLDYLGWIPFDEHVPAAVCRQQPVLQLYPEAPASKSFLKLAKAVWSSGKQPQVSGNIKFFWRRLINL
ncbi:MAG: MinD/ParA family protein [Deltaproteobacteria bacterium]|nr:MinD/ParA family protein [Deltaproteobacteria bacterium]MBW2069712.1 MinD/ParA family protein [Deltaproteobacteria bacterium]